MGEMFKLFGVDSHFLTNAITRIMSNVDKNFDGMISPQEFYTLLSQKFEKGDPMSEIKSVFARMDTNHDGQLDVDELHNVSQMLGENITKAEIKEMIKMFNLLSGRFEEVGACEEEGPKHAGTRGTTINYPRTLLRGYAGGTLMWKDRHGFGQLGVAHQCKFRIYLHPCRPLSFSGGVPFCRQLLLVCCGAQRKVRTC